ncbi:MAG: ferritin [Chloroflexota bacterium]|nr:ferritin [Chloroflexota bacterium]
MALSQTLQDALNEQLKQELYSSYLYLAMAAYCDAQNLQGFAHWMLLQADEEREHAMRFFNFIQDRGGRVMLKALPGPPSDFASPVDVFEQALAHEQEITSLIEQLYQRAAADQDQATQIFLQGFISEQVEEERTASQIVETLKMAGDNRAALLLIDRELAQRTPESTPATP